MNMDRLALIAGEGVLPVILAERLFKLGILYIVIVLQGKKERFDFISEIVVESAPGRLKAIIDKIRKRKINKLIMLGNIDKRGFLERKGYDLKALMLLRYIKNGNDMSIFHALNREFESIGVEILAQDKYLDDCIAHKGIIAGRRPSKKQIQDAEFGIDYARQIATMDIGQTVVVKKKVITAVEALEGTSEAIKRGAVLGRKGSIVCKACRANQDKRFDIPAVGLSTLEVMAEHECSLLALEAEKIFIIDPEEFIKYAESSGISVIGI
jgi:UDP-2,3-diacylglucosamine hydrolase